jgi:hypothetical protein
LAIDKARNKFNTYFGQELPTQKIKPTLAARLDVGGKKLKRLLNI